MAKKVLQTILVVMPTGDYPERLKLEGILKYAQERHAAHWSLKLDIGGIVGKLIRRGTRPVYDGIIAYVQSDRERENILNMHLPAVLIEDQALSTAPISQTSVVSIVCDHFAEGRTAARYFLDRHYENFAFVGSKRETGWSILRKQGFAAELKQNHRKCISYDGRDSLEIFLKKLHKPCALFAERDQLARQVLDVAETVGLNVPDDLAVLGVDNDEIMCVTSTPPLSSIPTFDRALGYAAGRALNQLFTGKSKGGTIYTRHANVISRRSTDSDAIPDAFVASAIRYARSHLAEALDTKTIAAAIGYSERALNDRAQRTLGMTLPESIRQMRIKAAEMLLLTGDIPISEVASACGFSNVSHLSLRLREATGQTPLAYRKHHLIRP